VEGMVFRASVLENGKDILSVPAACMAEGYFVYRIETATGVAIRANNTLVETRAAPTPNSQRRRSVFCP